MEYIIILPITFEVIIGVLMLLLGAGYTFVANITDMIRGISWVSFFLWTFFQAGREIVYAFRERRFIWILYGIKYLFFGAFFSYFPYALCLVFFDNAEKVNCISVMISLAILIIMCAVDNWLMKEWAGVGAFITALIIQFVVMIVPQVYAYNVWAAEILETPVEESITYKLDRESFPIVEAGCRYKYKYGVAVSYFPLSLSMTGYKLKKFHKGEVVYSIGNQSDFGKVGWLKSGKFRYEDCPLVCNADRSVVGYIPISHFEEYADKELLESVKEDALGQSFEIYNLHKNKNGSSREIQTHITFLDASTLYLKESKFTPVCKENCDGMVFEDWEEESMIQEAYYSYEFTKTKKEEVILSFNNGKYNVEINYNNNTISSIHAID